MRVHRVFPYSATAAPGEPGHATFVPVGLAAGRLDNPDHYATRYFAETAIGAVAERFGALDAWTAGMFDQPRSGRRLALATFELPSDVRLLDLDDAQALADRRLRPTQVVRRDLAVTQAWALRIFEERRSARGARRWDGVRWWSWFRPEWPVLGLWSGDVELMNVERLQLDHPAVREAALALGRPLP
jgi:hypothetical protein